MLKSLTVRGSFRGPTGYDHHTREFARELHGQGVEIELQDHPGWSPAKLPAHMQDPFFETLRNPVASETVLHFCMPHQVAPVAGKANVNFTVFEADRVPSAWVDVNLKHAGLIVPTDSSKAAWVKSGFPGSRIRVCPYGVDGALFSRRVDPIGIEGVADRRVRFLNISEFNSRKNLPGLLEAWLLATTARDDAALIIKLGCYESGALPRFEQELQRIEQRLGKNRRQAAPVEVFTELLPESHMPALYAAATHYISMSYGEGWDLPMMDAAAAGLKLIAPAHSSYLAYLDDSIASLIPSDEIPAIYESNPRTAAFFEGANWWRPRQEDTIGYIRAAIDGRDAGRASARDRILRDFSWAGATRRLIQILEEIETVTAKLRLFAMLRANMTPPPAPAHSESIPPPEPDPA